MTTEPNDHDILVQVENELDRRDRGLLLDEDAAFFTNIRTLITLLREAEKDAARYYWIECNADVDLRGYCPGEPEEYGSLSDMIDAAMEVHQ